MYGRAPSPTPASIKEAPSIEQQFQTLSSRSFAPTPSPISSGYSALTDSGTSTPTTSCTQPPLTLAEVLATTGPGRDDSIPHRLRSSPVKTDASPAVVAKCIEEVLGIPASGDFLESLRGPGSLKHPTRTPSGTFLSARRKVAAAVTGSGSHPLAPIVSRLAIRGKNLLNDNRRMSCEIESLKAERAELEAQLLRVQGAMENMVRVSEIISVGSRIGMTPPASPCSEPSTMSSIIPPNCATCGAECTTCGGSKLNLGRPALNANGGRIPIAPPEELRTTALLTVKPPPFGLEQSRPMLPPPPRRASWASGPPTPRASAASPPAALSPSSSAELDLAEVVAVDDCGVSLNRFKVSDEIEEVDETAVDGIDDDAFEFDSKDSPPSSSEKQPGRHAIRRLPSRQHHPWRRV